MSRNRRRDKKAMVHFVIEWLPSIHEMPCSRKIFVKVEKSHNVLPNKKKKKHHSNIILFKYIARRGVD